MNSLKFYIVDVFASNKYEGNQLAVFLDTDNHLSDEHMQRIAFEINFAETTFIKAVAASLRCTVRIFTPEHEVPFAGHPSLGTSYILAKFMLPHVPKKLTLALPHSDIDVSILDTEHVDDSLFFMRQAQPEFREIFRRDEIAEALAIPLDDLDERLPIQEITTGLPYIIIPLKTLAAINNLSFTADQLKAFLLARKKYRTNSSTGHSTSLFFFTSETNEPGNAFNTRMLLIENNKLSEDAATGSANGCFLAYLLKYQSQTINAVVEQGFQLGRKSYLHLEGKLENEAYHINVGGQNRLVSEGNWFI